MINALVNAVRIPHLVKNVLLFLPLLLAHEFNRYDLWANVVLGFICFSCLSMSTYLINDVFDIAYDREHPLKRQRPLASGQLSVSHALITSVLLLALGIGISVWMLPRIFLITLLCYFTLTLLYSTHLKRLVLIDVMVLAVLYTLRLLAGANSVGIVASYWLLAFALFFFMSLALVKRFAELKLLEQHHLNKAPGRNYQVRDNVVLMIAGVACNLTAITLFSLYLHQHAIHQLYSHPAFLWLSCLVLFYWNTRLWLYAQRSRISGDPIHWALRDGVSFGCLAVIGLSFILAL